MGMQVKFYLIDINVDIYIIGFFIYFILRLARVLHTLNHKA